MTLHSRKTLILAALGLVLGLTTSGCQKNKAVAAPITPLCQQTHQHILSLLKRELAILSATTASSTQQKKAKKFAARIKSLESKRGKERALKTCSTTSKNKARLAAHVCASKATSTQEVQRCYLPKAKPKQKRT